jgi:hypothetical protein
MNENTHYTKLVRLEEQLARLVADIESEKDTRRRVNLDYETRLRNLEKTIWKAAGALAVLQSLISYLLK